MKKDTHMYTYAKRYTHTLYHIKCDTQTYSYEKRHSPTGLHIKRRTHNALI